MAAFLQQVGGFEVDQDALERQRQAHGGECGADTLARLADRLVGQADQDEAGRPGAICTCTSTGTASMPLNAKVLAIAMVED